MPEPGIGKEIVKLTESKIQGNLQRIKTDKTGPKKRIKEEILT